MVLNSDQRPKRGFWAPGGYYNKCTICGNLFIGDKRALWCSPCAYNTCHWQADRCSETGRHFFRLECNGSEMWELPSEKKCPDCGKSVLTI